MKKSLILFGSLLTIASLTGCNDDVTPHEHTFKEEWSSNEVSHWKDASCEHTELTKDFGNHIDADLNGECDVCHHVLPAPVHTHTYDEEWSTNKTHHWRESTCEHKGLASELGEHTYDEDGKCTVCGYEKEKVTFNFTFKSDYCDLTNNPVYEEGTQVTLFLTLKDEFKGILTLPSDVEVFSDGVLLVKDVDYTYEIKNDIGNLKLKVKGNTVVQVYRNNDESVFKVTEDEYNYATNAANFDYLQYDLFYMRYYSTALIMMNVQAEYSPNVAYRGGASLTTTSYMGDLYYYYSYIEKVDDAYTEYRYDDVDEGWKVNASTEEDFNDQKEVVLTMFPLINDSFTLTYDLIKDHYNPLSNAYEIEFDTRNNHVKFAISFYEGKLVNVTYGDDSSYGFTANIDVSYEEQEVVIPEDAKPHEHTFSTEWSTDEEHHWHQATCEHTDVMDGYDEHIFGSDGKCVVCGYTSKYIYPVITEVIDKKDGFGSTTWLNEWDDENQYVISKFVGSTAQYLAFNDDGHIIGEGEYYENEEPLIMLGYEYADDLMTSKMFYKDGEVCAKEVYTYNDQGMILSIKHFDVDGEFETLFKEEDYEYFADYYIETTKEYEEGIQTSIVIDKWTTTYEGGNKKETLERSIDGGEFKNCGCLVYNSEGFLIQAKDYYKIGDVETFECDEITYTEDGNLATVINHLEGEAGQKKVYTYDENGFKVKEEYFDYNTETKEYDILYGGINYKCDSRGTIIESTQFSIIDPNTIVITVTAYVIKYVEVDFDIEYEFLIPETKGTYNEHVLDYIYIIG